MGFDEYIQIIKRKLPELKQNKIKLRKFKNQLYKSKAIGDLRYNGGVIYSQTKHYTLGLDNVKGYVFSSGLEKKITQPLLYNFFGRIDRFTEANAKMNYGINEISIMLQNDSLITYYKKLYIRWLQYEAGLKVLKKNIVTSQKLESHVRRKAKRGLSDNDDIQKAYASTLSQKIIHENYKRGLDILINELSVIFETKINKPNLKEFSSFFKKSLSFTFQKINFEKTANSKLLKLILKNQEYHLSINKNKQLPELNLLGSITKKSSETSASNSFSNINDFDYYLGMKMSYSFGNHENKGSLEDAKLSIKESQEEYNITKRNYTEKIRYIQITKKSFLKQIKFRNQNLNSLRSQYRTERRKYNQARLNLSYLIQTENSILAAKMSNLDLQSEIIMQIFDYKELIK